MSRRVLFCSVRFCVPFWFGLVRFEWRKNAIGQILVELASESADGNYGYSSSVLCQSERQFADEFQPPIVSSFAAATWSFGYLFSRLLVCLNVLRSLVRSLARLEWLAYVAIDHLICC